MSKNAIIAESNKEAFSKFTPAEYNDDEVDSIDDISNDYDFRENKEKRWLITNCYFCWTCIRVDWEWEDYPWTDEFIHCEDCMRDAILRHCM